MFFENRVKGSFLFPKVKICGVRDIETARWAVNAGVDAIGLMFYPSSPRAVSPQVARDIASAISGSVDVIGVFVNPEEVEVSRVIEMTGLTGLQFHGEEQPEFCEQWNLPWLKAVPVNKASDLDSTLPVWNEAFACLLDTHAPGLYGGSGKTFDWRVIPERWKSSIVLSGGLCPDNVAMAMNIARPFALDVSSGVEEVRGKKSKVLIEAFMKEVKGARPGH